MSLHTIWKECEEEVRVDYDKSRGEFWVVSFAQIIYLILLYIALVYVSVCGVEINTVPHKMTIQRSKEERKKRPTWERMVRKRESRAQGAPKYCSLTQGVRVGVSVCGCACVWVSAAFDLPQLRRRQRCLNPVTLGSSAVGRLRCLSPRRC